LYRRGMQLVNGLALIARLLKSAAELGVELWVSAPAKQLVIGDGAVQGAVVGTPGGDVRIRARRGTVLASGGFPNDVARRREMFPRTPTGREHWSLAPESIVGDGLRLGEAAGGHVDWGLASPVAWAPVSLVPRRDGTVGHFPHIIDRGKPGIIGVLADGHRFVNEADGYYDYVAAMVQAVPFDAEVASWLICDHPTQRRYSLGFAKPSPVPLGPYLRSGYLKRGRTIADLARVCGIDPAGLERTVAEYNRTARNGEDPAFGRGSTPYNRNSGDKDRKPNPCVAPIERGPFYAVKVLPGSFGTFAGLKTDAHTRVLNADGDPIPGLHAAGTDMSSVFGGYYPSGGINIGPAMTFGYVAGRYIAGVGNSQSAESSAPIPSSPGRK
jgi:succinate dehydrogenase/fumarate reductase flavoprotein subunit